MLALGIGLAGRRLGGLRRAQELGSPEYVSILTQVTGRVRTAIIACCATRENILAKQASGAGWARATLQQEADRTVQVNWNESPAADEALPLIFLPLTLPLKLKPLVPTQSKLLGEPLNFGFLKEPVGLHEQPRLLPLRPETARSK